MAAPTVKAILTPSGNKTAGTSFQQPVPALDVGDILVFGVSTDNTNAASPIVTINKPANEVSTWSFVSWTNPTSASGGGLHGRILYIRATVPWDAGNRTITLSASVAAKVSGGYVLAGADIPILGAVANSHATATASLAFSAATDDSITVFLAGQESTAIGTLGGPVASGVNDTGGATSGGSSTSNIAARMRTVSGTAANGTSTQTGSVDKGILAVAFPAVVPLIPATKLNIGDDVGKNHFKLVVSPPDGGAVIQKTLAEVEAGYALDDAFIADASNTKIMFKAYANGALQDDGYPGVELREVNADGSAMEFNALTGEHIMTGTTQIVEVPNVDPELIFAHLHDGAGSRFGIGFYMDDLEDYYHVVWKDNAPLWTGQLTAWTGSSNDWKLRVINGTIQVYFNNPTVPVYTYTLTAPTIPDKWHFRVGMAARFKVGEVGYFGGSPSATDDVRVDMTALSVSHTHGDPTPTGHNNIEDLLAAHDARWDFSNPANYALNGLNQVISAVDVSGNGATISAEGTPVIEQINGHDAIRFNGGNSLNGIAPSSIPQPFTAWAVVQMFSVDPDYRGAPVGHIRGVIRQQGGTWRAATSALDLNSGVTATLAPTILIAQFDGTSSKIHIDGPAVDATGTLDADSANIYYLGRNGWGGEGATARVGESGVYPGKMNSTELTLLYDYLYAKWMIPPASDTLKIAIGDAILAFDKLYIGTTKINRVYVGDVMVYDDV